jgi:hypothetical protein
MQSQNRTRSWRALMILTLLAASGARLGAQEDRGLKVKEMAGERRVALVIGNAAYDQAPLKNPVNDARAIAAALRELKFDVVERTDGTRQQMLEAIREYSQKLKSGGVGLFYYAGHGMELKGKNYLIPVGLPITSEFDVVDNAVEAQRVLEIMDEAKNRINIVILDACRDNPFPRSTRSGSRGLAKMEARGTFLAYATDPGSVASDGVGEHGLYTEALLRHIRKPGVPLEMLFKEVRKEVQQSSGGQQVPWDNSSLTGDFYFTLPEAPAVQTASAQGPGQTQPAGPATLEPSAAFSAAMGTLAVFCLQEDCAVQIDGKQLGKTAKGQYLTLTLPAGELEVLVTRDGYEAYAQKVALLPSQRQEVIAQLKSLAPAPVAVQATVQPLGFRLSEDAAPKMLDSLPDDLNPFHFSYDIGGNVAGATVVGVWIAEEVEGDIRDYQIDASKLEMTGPSTVTFSLHRPEAGWPKGRYRLELRLGDEVLHKHAFELVAAKPPAVAPARSQATSVVVRSNVADDRLFINGRSVGGTGPKAHEVPPGKVILRVEKDGHSPWEQEVQLGSGEQRTLRAQLTAVSARAVPPPAAPKPAQSQPAASAAVNPSSPAGRWAGAFNRDGVQLGVGMQITEEGGGRISAVVYMQAKVTDPSSGQQVTLEVSEFMAGTIKGKKLKLSGDKATVTIKELGQTVEQPGDKLEATLSDNGQSLNCRIPGSPPFDLVRWHQ